LTMRRRAMRPHLKNSHPGPSAPVPSPTVPGAAPRGSATTLALVIRMTQDLDHPIKARAPRSKRPRGPAMVLSSRNPPVARWAQVPILTMRRRALRPDLKTCHPGPSAPAPSPTVRGAAPRGSASTWAAVIRMTQNGASPAQGLCDPL
jgi:hypothetical protein